MCLSTSKAGWILFVGILFLTLDSYRPWSIEDDQQFRSWCTSSKSFINADVNHNCEFKIEKHDQLNLLEMINKTNSRKFGSWLSETDDYNIQPSLRVCTLTRITPQIASYAAYSYFIQSYYASRHYGYIMLPLFSDSQHDDYEYHRKLVPILDALQDDKLSCDFVFWMDADLIPLDVDITVQSILSMASSSYEDSCRSGSQSHIWLSQDVSTTINTGGMIFRNTKWARDFISEWISAKDHKNVYNEQLGFDYVLSSSKGKVKEMMEKRLCIMDHHILNSVAPAVTQQLSHHKILHLAAEHDLYREAVFREAVKYVCSTSVHLPLKHQLGLTREKLQTIALDIYQALSDYHANYLQSLFLSDIEDEAKRFLHFNSEKVLTSFSSYRMSISKLVHVLVHKNNGGEESEESIGLRSQAYYLLTEITCGKLVRVVFPEISELLMDIYNFKIPAFEDKSYLIDQEIFQYRNFRYPRLEYEVKSNLPEYLKFTVELGYEYLTNCWAVYGRLGPVDSQKEVELNNVERLMRMQLHVLKELVHSSQIFTVQNMINDFERFIENVRVSSFE